MQLPSLGLSPSSCPWLRDSPSPTGCGVRGVPLLLSGPPGPVCRTSSLNGTFRSLQVVVLGNAPGAGCVGAKYVVTENF